MKKQASKKPVFKKPTRKEVADHLKRASARLEKARIEKEEPAKETSIFSRFQKAVEKAKERNITGYFLVTTYKNEKGERDAGFDAETGGFPTMDLIANIETGKHHLLADIVDARRGQDLQAMLGFMPKKEG